MSLPTPMTDLEKICEAQRLLQSVRDNYQPDHFPDLDCAIVFVTQVRNQVEQSNELEREKRYQDALRYDFPEASESAGMTGDCQRG